MSCNNVLKNDYIFMLLKSALVVNINTNINNTILATLIYQQFMFRKLSKNKTKIGLKNLYNDPMGSISQEGIQKWAAVQVVKAFFGIPIIPGK